MDRQFLASVFIYNFNESNELSKIQYAGDWKQGDNKTKVELIKRSILHEAMEIQ